MARNWGFSPILGILVDIMLFAMTQEEATVGDEVPNKDMSFQKETSISLILMSERLIAGSVSNISW